ncbi:uncharacterized protein LOC121740242 [Aricia agestis]|uniref:uncharacterized protein LOC121740242 n=1 Tax=Aricia agestis TaxID=91739 RepID=UPI001C20A4B1|nr:uncharacterized protein LOC121740242 [Aricia agestis]
MQEHKATQVVLSQTHKAVQVCQKAHIRSRQVQANVRSRDVITSPIKFNVSIATSPLKSLVKSTIKPSTSQSTALRKLDFLEGNCDSDTSCAPSLAGSAVEQDYSPSKTSMSKTTSDTSLQAEHNKLEKINLQSTLSKILNKPKLYIGITKNLYFIIDLIKKHTDITLPNILLCLMKIKLNRTFSQLSDDFDLSVTQASNIFFNNMPLIVKVLSPIVKQFSSTSIKKNLPIAFRHRYNQVTCIIDCLEIEIQKPAKAMHQALTWSEYKKTNTIKYLVSCTPDGLVNFVSNGYAGRVSDVNLLEQSKFLECLQPGSYILADRGFKSIESLLSQKGFALLRPPSVHTGTKLSKKEVKQTKQIASLRIHIERVIRRLREFSILKMHTVVNSNLIGMLDLCIKTACALINLQDSLIK